MTAHWKIIMTLLLFLWIYMLKMYAFIFVDKGVSVLVFYLV